jgi:tetratricopeptide (TPR) repeat protein
VIAFLSSSTFKDEYTERGIMLTTAQEHYQNKNFKKCFLQLIQLSQKMSHDLDFLDLLYKVQIKLQDLSAAVKTLTVILSKSDRTDYALAQMNLLMSLNRHNEALDIGLSLQSKNLGLNESKQLFHNFIDIYIVFNDFEGLQEVLNQYQPGSAQDDVGLFAQGLLHIHNDHVDEAMICLRQAIQINPHLDRAWVSLAIMHNKMGDMELAIANIEKALDINSQNPVAVKCYAIWKEQLGEYKLACSKVSSYLQENNFDQEMTRKEIDLLHKLGLPDLAFTEEVKLRYYFGHI